jgi:predicted transcriptional regulator
MISLKHNQEVVMASNKGRRSARNTPTGANALGIQKKINQDYAILLKDYGKLFSELWRKPMTKFVLGGFALSAAIPFFMRQNEA